MVITSKNHENTTDFLIIPKHTSKMKKIPELRALPSVECVT